MLSWPVLSLELPLRLNRSFRSRTGKFKLFILTNPANIHLDENVFKTPSRRLCLQKTSSRRLDQNEYFRLGYMSWRRFQDVLKTSSRRLARTSSWRHPQDVLGRYLQDVFKTYDHISIQHVFEMYCKDDYLQKDLPGSYFWGIYSQGTKFSRMNSLDIWKLLKQFFKTLCKVARYYC